MEKKKLGPAIILWGFIIIICLIWLWWLVLYRFVDTTNYENRELAAMPTFTTENYTGFAGEFESFLNDRLPFRNAFITLNSSIDFYIFKESSSDAVVIGKKDWLFYSDVTDGDPIACYQGTNLFTPEELRYIANKLTVMKEQLAEQDCEFVLYIAPNKERVYSEYMPEEYGEPAEDSRVMQLIWYLDANTDIKVVYPYEDLMDAKSAINENIFYKTDTHWNYVGSYIGSQVLLRELGVDMPAITDSEITIEHGEPIAGDLAAHLNLSAIMKKNDCEYRIVGYDDHSMKNLAYDFYYTYEYEAKDADPRTLYVLRDSFGNYMAPYLGSQFDITVMRHQNTYTYDDVVAADPDVFVYEVCERKLWKLLALELM